MSTRVQKIVAEQLAEGIFEELASSTETEDSACDFYSSNYWRECTTHSDCREQVCGDCGDIEQCDTLPKN